MYSRVNDLDFIIPSLTTVCSSLKLDNVHSCMAVGCGYGLLDLIFVQQCIPNISKFIAIEPDSACASELRAKLPKQLPSAESIVFEETVQSWQDVDDSVDVVLLIHFLYYLNPRERAILCQRLMDSIVHPGGFVFILIHPHHTSGESSAYCRVIQELKSSKYSDEFITDGEVRDAMSLVGFELCYEQMYNCHLNVADPDDAFLSLFLRPAEGWSLELVRQAAKKIFGDAKEVQHDSWLGIFRKP